jgi:hypothetical protein
MSIFTLNKSCILLILLLITSCRSGDNDYAATPPEIPISNLRSGDIAFRLGRTLESRVIATEGGYSHVGIVIRHDSTLQIAHIEPSRGGSELTKYESLEQFFHPDNATSGAVMRIEGLGSEQQASVENYLFACKNITFDHDYKLSDTTQMYCTELAFRAFSEIGIDITNGIRHRVPLAQEEVILPTDISNNDRLVEIWRY